MNVPFYHCHKYVVIICGFVGVSFIIEITCIHKMAVQGLLLLLLLLLLFIIVINIHRHNYNDNNRI